MRIIDDALGKDRKRRAVEELKITNKNSRSNQFISKELLQ
jgi:hypothetical protein